jgi:hypothetical protein
MTVIERYGSPIERVQVEWCWKFPERRPGPDEDWTWVQSPDIWEEDEVLLQGVRRDVEVTKQ